MLLLNDFTAALHFLIVDCHILEIDSLHNDLVVLADDLEDLTLLPLVFALVDLDDIVSDNLPVFEWLLNRPPGEESHLVNRHDVRSG